MTTPATEVVKVNWKQIAPWLILFRSLGMTLHVRQLIVGIAAVTLIVLVQWLVGYQGLMGTLQEAPTQIVRQSFLVWSPVMDVIPRESALGFRNGSAAPFLSRWSVTIGELLRIGVTVIISSLAGGVIARRAALEFAREESLSLTSAIHYVRHRLWDYLSAPALPLAAVMAGWLLLVLVGWLARSIPGFDFLVSMLWVLVCVAAAALGAFLVMTLVAWPLMVAAVSVNGGDGFDSLSRGFGFVLDRWRYYGWCVIVQLAYGAVCIGLGWGLLFVSWEVLVAGGLDSGTHLPRLIRATWWSTIILTLVRGLAYTYFWVSMTLIYLVLRKSVDNALLQDVYTEGDNSDPEDLQALINPQLNTAPTLLPIIDPP